MSHEDNHQTEEREFVQSRREKAEQGDLSAQFALAYFYHSRDNAEALRWFERAAGQGHAEARFWAGKMYADGDGVQKNSEEALRWLRLAAEQGHGSAQARLATMYVEGDGVQKNGEEALRWLRLAAEARVIDALMDLGKMHLKGEGVPQDHAEAERLLSLAAELDPEVQAEVVGDMYAEGRDVRQDGEKAAKFYSWNINENLETSQPVKVKLGLLYLDGLGVPKDEAEARRWFEEAFEYSELPEAAHQIGMLYERDSYGKITFVRYSLEWLTAR